jgi:hypothetical protein
MQPQEPWQQQQPQYGPPPQQPQHPQPPYPQQRPQYPPQQSTQSFPATGPVTGTFTGSPMSGVPMSGPPTSAPPGPQYPGPQYPMQQQYPPAPPKKKGNWGVALIAGIAVLVVTAVAIVVVLAVRRNGSPDPAAAPSASTGPVDKCLIGKWNEVEYQHDVELGDTKFGKANNLGKERMRGGGTVWTINEDGSAVSDSNKTLYTAVTADGRTVTAKFSGSSKWTLKTDKNTINYAGLDGDEATDISVNGTKVGRIELTPNYDPAPYTCSGDFWRMSKSDTEFTTYKRTS